MTKPLPIGILKKTTFVDLDILYKAVNDFDPNSKIGHAFVVDIHFQDLKIKKKMCNEIYPCISEPKTKVPVDERSVYQLLSNMRVGKKDNILKLLVTEKTHATLKRKKYFPMFLNHIDFLTKRAGRRVIKVYSHCTFE